MTVIGALFVLGAKKAEEALKNGSGTRVGRCFRASALLTFQFRPLNHRNKQEFEEACEAHSGKRVWFTPAFRDGLQIWMSNEKVDAEHLGEGKAAGF